jgi:hypothetical protein
MSYLAGVATFVSSALDLALFAFERVVAASVHASDP